MYEYNTCPHQRGCRKSDGSMKGKAEDRLPFILLSLQLFHVPTFLEMFSHVTYKLETNCLKLLVLSTILIFESLLY